MATVTERSGPIQANRTRASLSAFFMWCCRRGLLEVNSVGFTERHKEESRHRVLSDSELRQLWNALPDTGYGRAVKLLILTGQRRQEIGMLRWSEIDFTRGVISLPAERTKNGKPWPATWALGTLGRGPALRSKAAETPLGGNSRKAPFRR